MRRQELRGWKWREEGGWPEERIPFRLLLFRSGGRLAAGLSSVCNCMM